jgi:hypothetical protein
MGGDPIRFDHHGSVFPVGACIPRPQSRNAVINCGSYFPVGQQQRLNLELLPYCTQGSRLNSSAIKLINARVFSGT